MSKIIEIIESERKARKVKKHELAKAGGISPGYYAKIIRKCPPPSLFVVENMASYLGLEIAVIIRDAIH